MAGTRFAFLSYGRSPCCRPSSTPQARTAARPDLNPIAAQVPLELGQARHDGAHQLAARGAEIEAEARLSQDANFPAVQIVER
jgi:hypothetical protein